MRKAFLVCGPESSGNKLTTQLFCMAGCAGTWTEPQDLNHFVAGREHDITKIIGKAQVLVYIQSIPGGPIYRPDLPAIKRRFESAGFPTSTIIVSRDWHACTKSKLLHGHQSSLTTAWSELEQEWIHVGQCLLHLRPFYILSTSYLFLSPTRALIGLEHFTGLQFPKSARALIDDADAKHFTRPFPQPQTGGP